MAVCLSGQALESLSYGIIHYFKITKRAVDEQYRKVWKFIKPLNLPTVMEPLALVPI